MLRVAVLAVLLVSSAHMAFAGTSSVPIIIYTPAIQPGDACIPDGVGSGEETRTSKGATVLAAAIHGANATRCPDPMFPNLATTEKLPSDEERQLPSSRCVSKNAKVGDELTIRSYGRALVLELDASRTDCVNGIMAKVVGAAAYRTSTSANKSTPAPAASSALNDEPTESDIRNEYDRLAAAMAKLQEYHVRHILLKNREDALAALDQIRSGRAFADVAADVSTDLGSKKRGGDLGWNVPTAFIEAFSQSMVSLAPSGLAAEPVKTGFGWHIIEVLGTRAAKDSVPPLALVKTRIADYLRQRNRAARTAAQVPARAVCRKMVAPVIAAAGANPPQKGSVSVEMRVENGRVTDILKISGPNQFHAAVTDAVKQYECDRLDRSTVVVQTFEF